MQPKLLTMIFGCFALAVCTPTPAADTTVLTPRIVVEEDVYTALPPNNGAGPMWSYGCTTIVRDGDRVIASQMETSPDTPPPCNTRWKLLERRNGKWVISASEESFKQREPCPIGLLGQGKLFLSVNDAVVAPGPNSMPCKPHLLQFDLNDWTHAPATISPLWNAQDTHFTEHSYRGLAFDRNSNQILTMNIDSQTSIQHWVLVDQSGKTLSNGQIQFPIRACYPQVALQGNASHVMAISDIVEPNEQWRTYKFEQTQRQWDYVFRILYYTWSDDLTSQPYAAPIEIANVESTAGYIHNHDLWVSPDGTAYLLYSQREVADERMRGKFFPGHSTHTSLHLAVVKDGAVVDRHVLIEGSADRYAGVARFHEAADHRLYVFAHTYHGQESNVLIPVYPNLQSENFISIIPKIPFRTFFLSNVRGGSVPSNIIDVFGHRGAQEILSYAQIELH